MRSRLLNLDLAAEVGVGINNFERAVISDFVRFISSRSVAATGGETWDWLLGLWLNILLGIKVSTDNHLHPWTSLCRNGFCVGGESKVGKSLPYVPLFSAVFPGFMRRSTDEVCVSNIFWPKLVFLTFNTKHNRPWPQFYRQRVSMLLVGVIECSFRYQRDGKLYPSESVDNCASLHWGFNGRIWPHEH